MKKIIASALIVFSLFLVSCDIGAQLESYSDQLMSQFSEAAGSFLKEATPTPDDEAVPEDTSGGSEDIIAGE